MQTTPLAVYALTYDMSCFSHSAQKDFVVHLDLKGPLAIIVVSLFRGWFPFKSKSE